MLHGLRHDQELGAGQFDDRIFSQRHQQDKVVGKVGSPDSISSFFASGELRRPGHRYTTIVEKSSPGSGHFSHPIRLLCSVSRSTPSAGRESNSDAPLDRRTAETMHMIT